MIAYCFRHVRHVIGFLTNECLVDRGREVGSLMMVYVRVTRTADEGV